jgi:ribosomal 30S subunit maturation factor RimM
VQDPDEFWVQDLVGCSVSLQGSGEVIGVVVDLVSGTGTYDSMVVQLNLTAKDIESSSTR